MPATKSNQRMLATIMFTDVVGYSALMQSDEADTLAKTASDIEMITSLCLAHGGRVIKNTGDGLLMHFPAAVNAVECALEVQQRLGHAGEGHLQHRIGLHLGDVFMTEDDMLGDGVNIAARVMAHADPGGVCFSQTVYDVVKNAVSLRATYLGARELKNIREAMPIYQIVLAAAQRQAVRAGGDQMPLAGAAPSATAPKAGGIRGRDIAVAASAIIVLAVMLVWWTFNQNNRRDSGGTGSTIGNSVPSGSGPAGAAAVAHHDASEIGTGMYRRVGFKLPELVPIQGNSPTLYLPENAGELNLKITPLNYVHKDHAGFTNREVDLWLPVRGGSIGTTPGPSAGKLRSVRPAQGLADGVYCLHNSSDNADFAGFNSIFIVGGYHKAAVSKLEVSSSGDGGKLLVTISNQGERVFDGGQLTVTLQRETETIKPIFSGRWSKTIPPVAAKSSVVLEIPVESREKVAGKYHCHGWIGYPTGTDSIGQLDSFDSPSFQLTGQ